MVMKFERLQIWQRAVDHSAHIHEITRTFPKEELYVLTSQMKRAADSVALNIAEGSTGQTNAEFKQFLGYAIRSAIETIACLHLGKRRGLISEIRFQRLYEEGETLITMTQSLRQSLGMR